MLALIAIACFVILPLTLVGTIIGKNINGQPNFPCRVNVVPRPIPEKRWFMEPAVISILGGILPFGSIFIEMYFILTSFWAYKIYYVYGFILLGPGLIQEYVLMKLVLFQNLNESSGNSWHSNSVCDHRLHIFPIERRGLPLALDVVSLGSINVRLRVSLLHLLFLFQNAHVRLFPGNFRQKKGIFIVFRPRSISVTWQCSALVWG